MDIKALESKKNLITAQLRQLTDSGLFTEEQIERMSKSYNAELDRLNGAMETPGSMEVNGPEIVS